MRVYIGSVPFACMAGHWDILEHDAEDMAYFYGELIDDLVENQGWTFAKEIDWTADDPKTQALLKRPGPSSVMRQKERLLMSIKTSSTKHKRTNGCSQKKGT